MSTIDLILGALILFGIVRGFMRGFIFEIAILGTLFICFFFGFKIAHVVADFIEEILHTNPVTLHYISLFVAWIGISIGIYFLAKLFEGLINIVALGIFNKIAGALVGGLKYAVLISIFLFFLNKIDITFAWLNADAKANSHLYYPVLKISSWLL